MLNKPAETSVFLNSKVFTSRMFCTKMSSFYVIKMYAGYIFNINFVLNFLNNPFGENKTYNNVTYTTYLFTPNFFRIKITSDEFNE